jgi:hypothetical protein
MSDDRRAVLETIIYGTDARIAPGDRIRAMEMLERIPGSGIASDALMAMVTELESLSGEELENELVGFFNPGAPDTPPPGGGEPLPVRIEKEVERRAKRRMRRMVKDWADKRAEEIARRAVPAAARSTMPTQPEYNRPDNVVYLDSGERLDLSKPLTKVQQSRLTRQQYREDMRRKRNAYKSPLPQDPAPPGVDPKDWELWGAGSPFMR